MANIAGLFSNAKEYLTPVVARVVEGSVPSWLDGEIFRVGPAVFDLEGGFTVNYYQDGFAAVNKIDIRDGKVTLIQKVLESDAYKKAKICKRPVYAEFGTRAYPDTTKNIFKRIFSTLVPTDMTDNNVSNVYVLEDEVIVASETLYVHSLEKDTGAAKEKIDYSKYLPGVFLMTSHPLTDSDGTMWNIGASPLPTAKYHVIKIPSTGTAKQSLAQAKIVTTIDSYSATALTYNHSFTMTKNYVLFMEQPLMMSIIKMAQMGIKGSSVKDSFEWCSQNKNRMHVVEKETGKVLKTHFLTNEAYFALHYVNAYEENDQIVVDMIAYPNADTLENSDLKRLRSNEFKATDGASTMYRFVLPLISDIKSVTENENLVKSSHPTTSRVVTVRKGDKIIMTPQAIGEQGADFPVVNPFNLALPYRYYYASGLYFPGGFHKNAICKVDTETNEVKLIRTGHEDEYFGEVYFVPKTTTAGSDEDDGIVLSCVSSPTQTKSDYIVIADAKTFEQIAKLEFPNVKFSQTLHGSFIRRWISPSKRLQ